MLEHPFFEELYDPQNDNQVLEGNPVNYYDFEFEQYTINSDIIRELLLDEIIMANSKEARALNRELREVHKDGILEKIYERQEKDKKRATVDQVKSKANTLDEKKEVPVEHVTPDKKKEVEEESKGEDVEMTDEKTASASPVKEKESPAKFSEATGASPVRQIPSSFGAEAKAKDIPMFNIKKCGNND